MREFALPNQERKLSNTYTFNLQETNEILCFFTLSASQLNTGDARLFGIDKVPIVLLGRLGVDKNYKYKNLGKVMIQIALDKSLAARNFVACRFLVVETSLDMKPY